MNTVETTLENEYLDNLDALCAAAKARIATEKEAARVAAAEAAAEAEAADGDAGEASPAPSSDEASAE